jgi:hypothetical protein
MRIVEIHYWYMQVAWGRIKIREHTPLARRMPALPTNRSQKNNMEGICQRRVRCMRQGYTEPPQGLGRTPPEPNLMQELRKFIGSLEILLQESKARCGTDAMMVTRGKRQVSRRRSLIYSTEMSNHFVEPEYGREEKKGSAWNTSSENSCGFKKTSDTPRLSSESSTSVTIGITGGIILEIDAMEHWHAGGGGR